MTRRFNTLHKLALTLALLAPSPSLADEAIPMTKDEKSALTLIETMTTAFSQGDIDGVMDSYEPGAVILFQPDAALRDEAAIRAAFTEFAALNPRFSYGGHQVVVAGDIALHISPWQMQGTLPDGAALEAGGLSVAVLRRQSDGGWKMVIDTPYGDHHLNR